MDRSRHDDRRDFQPMVDRLLTNSPAYDPRAWLDDGRRILETTKAASIQPGAASILHAKWQEEGEIDRLSRAECAALARAGYQIQRDKDGYWVWWREKRISHLWLRISEDGWNITYSSSVKPETQWKLIGSFRNPVVPYFVGYHITVQDMVREGLTTAVANFREFIPEEVLNIQFFEVTKELCDEAIQNMELEQDWATELLRGTSTSTG